jgi:hypothetical protein
MARALFFNESYFFENSIVDENVNYDKLIRPIIWDCQELYIQDIIGTPLYNVLKDEITTNGGSLTTTRLITLNNTYIAPCLLNYTLMEAQVSMLYKMRNKSVMTDRGDFSDPVDYQTHNYLVDQFQNKAEQYAQRIESYLCANTETFPEYTTYTSSDEIRAQRQKPSVSVFLGNYGQKTNGFDY